MLRRLPLLAILLLALVAVVARPSTEEAGGDRKPASDRQTALLQGGKARYAAYVRAEAASRAERLRAGDPDGAAIHAGRIAPAVRARGADPVPAIGAAAAILSLDAREVGRRPLLDLESHAAGAGAALDGVRDALWARDEALTGEIDERLAHLRAELDAHRRGTGFRSAGALSPGERQRLSAALDALAWRLTVAARTLAGRS